MGSGTIRRVRFALAALALAAAGALLLWAILFSINLHARLQAQSLIVALRSMQVGSTTLEEARPILTQYRFRTVPDYFARSYSADTGFDILVGDKIIEGLGERFYFLRYLGLALFYSDAAMYFRDGRLCHLTFSVTTEVNRKEELRQGFALSTRQSLGKNEFVMSGGVAEGHRIYIGVHSIELPADATPAERAHALAYDVSCVTTLGGCRDVGQILNYNSVRGDFDARHSDIGNLMADLSEVRTTRSDTVQQILDLAEKDPAVRDYVVQRLPERIQFGTDEPWLNAVRLAGKLKATETISALQQAMSRPPFPDVPFLSAAGAMRLDDDVVAKALSQIGDSAIPSILNLLTSADDLTRERAVLILRNMNSNASRQALRDRLPKETNPDITKLIQDSLAS